MPIPKHYEHAVPHINEPQPQRPQNLLQRLSTGIVQVLPSLRGSSSRNHLIDHPIAAAGSSVHRERKGPDVDDSERLLVSSCETIPTGEPTQPCPYDSNSYHSFATIEKRRCSFCGMRGPKIVHNEPCHACKTGAPGSHLTSTGHPRRHSAIDTRRSANLANSSDSILLGPRPVTPERAVKRIGNPPRVSRLPPGIIRLPAASPTKASRPHDPFQRSPSRQDMGVSESETRGMGPQAPSSDRPDPSAKKPVSPRLHHLPLLPHSEDHPFVHRHEIPKHAIALRAGSTSQLTDRSNGPRVSSHLHGSTDYSDTVFYGGRMSPLPSNQASLGKPRTATVVVKQVQASGGASVDLCASSLNVTLADSRVCKKRSPEQTVVKPSRALGDHTDSSTTFGSQDTGSTNIGGMRLELKGGGSPTRSPRLRGGSGQERVSTNTVIFKIKRWILLCQPCSGSHDDSDDDLPPAREVTPERVAKMHKKMNGTASLPRHLCRAAASFASNSSATETHLDTGDLSHATRFTTTDSCLSKHSLSSGVSVKALSHGRPESLINQPARVTPIQILTPTFPQLRGGSSSPDRIPQSLFWLAGGTGRKPISFTGWKQSRLKKRIGGLLGMTVFGDRYGQEYKIEASVVSDVQIECSARVEVSAGDMENVEEGNGGADLPRSSPSVDSGASLRAEPVEGIAEPSSNTEPVQRALTPPPIEAVNDLSLCSGALPVEPNMGAPGDVNASSPSGENDDKKSDATAIEEKKAHLA